MADKVTLASIGSFQNDTTAAAAYNSNNALITTAMDNTLSRDGTTPNQMGSFLDMNSNQILNLPAPGTANSPARLVDVTSTNPISISLSLSGDVTAPASSGVLTTTIASQAVTASKIANNTITASQIASGTITSTQIANGTVTNADLANMNANTIKANNTGGAAAPTDITVPQLATMLSNPQATVFTSGSGTYNVPSNTKYLIIELVGGGGGGGGSGSAAGGASGAGGQTSVGSIAIANGGGGGSWNNTATPSGGGVGGTATAGTLQIGGANGGNSTNSISDMMGGNGGGSFFGSGGQGTWSNAAQVGVNATSPGSGGAGANTVSTIIGAGGGGAGGYVWHLQTSPSASYSYSVGAAGAGGTAGSSGAAGGNGAAGLIKIVAYFQ